MSVEDSDRVQVGGEPVRNLAGSPHRLLERRGGSRDRARTQAFSRTMAETEKVLKPLGGPMAETGLATMDEPSERLMVFWIVDVPRKVGRGALVAPEEVELWDWEAGSRA